MQSWGMPSIFYECLCWGCACMYRKFVSMGSTLLSSSFRIECVSVCVFQRSPQGLFQLRAKNTEKLWKSFYVLLSEMILRKALYKNTFYSGFHIQKGTYSITKLPSSLFTSINPASILRPACVLCAEAPLWAKCMSLVVRNVGHVSEYTVSQTFVNTFWPYCNFKRSYTHKKDNIFDCLSLLLLAIL